jgi:hypothetical protein
VRRLVQAIAAAETATGFVAIAAPRLLARLLFSGDGIALVGLGIASLGSSRDAVRGLLVYSTLAAVGLAALGASGIRGSLLWPAVALHSVLSILLFVSMRRSTHEEART